MTGNTRVAEHRFDAGLEVFRYHLPGFGVVPGALLLAGHVAMNTESAAVATFSDVRFTDFVRPGETFVYGAGSRPGEVTVTAGDRTCAGFTAGHDTTFDEETDSVASLAPRPTPAGLRPEEFWFLPESLLVGENEAGCSLDLDEILRAQPYLGHLTGWRTLVLLECLGNLALCLQHLTPPKSSTPSDRVPQYVFARFGRLRLRTGADFRRGTLTARTRVRRFGSILVWEGEITDGADMYLTVRDAVSTIWRAR
ncbi:hypothetical protein [Amycolatopsis sp. NPDC052450]|uniref:hypothetical protein n=1 Tax=Amycolatopsis sp. NPDC052450 TaxID=3363937 RepID=UPI0037CBB80E